jgi:hypothetical protein
VVVFRFDLQPRGVHLPPHARSQGTPRGPTCQ